MTKDRLSISKTAVQSPSYLSIAIVIVKIIYLIVWVAESQILFMYLCHDIIYNTKSNNEFV